MSIMLNELARHIWYSVFAVYDENNDDPGEPTLEESEKCAEAARIFVDMANDAQEYVLVSRDAWDEIKDARERLVSASKEFEEAFEGLPE